MVILKIKANQRILFSMDDTSNKKFKKIKKFCPRKRKRKSKLIIVFDENDRREFLTGFHKRKLQRKAKAREELEKQLKAERKRIKVRAKKEYMKLLLAQKPIPEITDFLSENIDMGTHSVSITELSTAELAKKNNWIGINEMQYDNRKSEEESNNNDNTSESEQEFEGMELKPKKRIKKKSNHVTAKSCKDIKKHIKLQATAEVKKSKVFQKKAQMEKIRNLKIKRRQEKLSRKVNKSKAKSKH